ncbi:MAG: ABC transporter substrate-binding protein, partial [Blautia sp.]|nr:ABC transporter substrate-binding protein [Blautia sp.]
MKKSIAFVLSLALSALLSVSALAAPASVYALKGPTSMGMVKLMSEQDELSEEEKAYTFQIVSAVDEIGPAIIQGNADIAAMPANLAAVLNQKTQGGIKVLAVNTLGVLYLVGAGEEITSIADLAGKTIYASGKGATPEYALNYILTGNGLDPEKDVAIEWKAEHAECLASLLADESAIAMLPQPFVTTAQMKNENVKVLLDLTQEWDKLQEGQDTPSTMITGVVAARTAFIEENPDAVKQFLADYEASINYAKDDVDG